MDWDALLTQLREQFQHPHAITPLEIAQTAVDLLRDVVTWHKATVALVGEEWHIVEAQRNKSSLPQHPPLSRAILHKQGYPNEAVNFRLLRPIVGDECMFSILSQKKPAVYANIQKEKPPAWENGHTTDDIVGWMVLPLFAGVQTLKLVGVITLDHRAKDNPYEQFKTGEAYKFLQALSGLTAAALEQTLIKRNTDIVSEVLQAINTEHQTEKLLQKMARVVVKRLNCSTCAFLRRVDVYHPQPLSLNLTKPSTRWRLLPQRGNYSTWVELWANQDGSTQNEQRHRRRFPPGYGVAGHVLLTKTSTLLSDAQHDPRFEFVDEESKQKNSMIVAPIMVKDRVIGVISVEDETHGFFSGYDLHLIQMLAEQCAAIIERTWTLQLTHETSLDINKQQHIENTLPKIIEHACRLTNANTGVLFTFRQIKRDTFEVDKHYKFPADSYHPEPRIDDPASLTRTLLRDKKRVQQFSDLDGNFHRIRPELRLLHGVRAVVGALLTFEDEVLGVLYLNSSSSQKRHFNDIELFSLELFANQAAIAIKNAALLAETERQVRDQKMLVEAINKANSSASQVFDIIVEQAYKAVGPAEYCHLAQVVQQMDQQVIRFVAAHPPEHLGGLHRRVQEINLTTGSRLHNGRKGIAGTAVLRRETIIIDDLANQAEWQRHYINYHSKTRSEIAVPIIADTGEVLGVINVEHSQPNAFHQKHRLFLEALAEQAAIAIKKSEFFQAMINRERQLTALVNATGRIIEAQPENFDAALQQVINSIIDALDAVEVLVLIVGDSAAQSASIRSPLTGLVKYVMQGRWRRRLHIEKIVNKNTTPNEIDVRLNGVTSTVLKTQAPYPIPDVQRDPNANPHLRRKAGSALCLPMISRKGIRGVMWFHFKERRNTPFSKDEINLFQLYCNQFALAYDSAQEARSERRELEQLRRDITTDLKANYDDVRAYARTYLSLSVVGFALGSLIMIAGALLVLTEQLSDGTLGILGGIIVQVFSGLAFARADAANKRMDEYHQELVRVYHHNVLMESSRQIENENKRDETRQTVIDITNTSRFSLDPSALIPPVSSENGESSR
jgi:GAF domain-containing protein